jgi:hypothetical protein
MIIERMLFSLILAPYLINVSKLSYDAALNIINSWLSKCGKDIKIGCILIGLAAKEQAELYK